MTHVMKAQLEVHLEVKLVFRGTFIIAQFAFRICDFISSPDQLTYSKKAFLFYVS